MTPVMIQPGTLLQKRYRVAEQVGKGGMGEVYVATDERFQSIVAIKRTFYNDPEMRKAFEREARLLNRLRHAALPKVSDHFSEGENRYLVMEFIEGSDLSELLKQRKVPFPLADVLSWADELLEALDYLHTQDPPVVHRDIKPSNIKLTTTGRVVLLDFGLAKGMPSQADAATASSVFGYSLSFAPLEQMQGSGTDPRSDLYSLAATLYFLLTGLRPTDALTRAAATVKGQPDPLRPAHLLQAQVSTTVSRILHRAMFQNSALRYASAAELRAALRQAANHLAAPLEALPKVMAENVQQKNLSRPQVAAPIKSPPQLNQPARPEAQPYLQPANSSPTPHGPSPSEGGTTFLTDPRLSEGQTTFLTDRHPKPLLNDSDTISTHVAAPRVGPTTRPRIMLVAGLFLVCAAASAYILGRASGSPVPATVVNTNSQSSSPVDAPSAPTDSKAPAASDLPADSSQGTPTLSVPDQSAPVRTVAEPTASNSQDATSMPDAVSSEVKGEGMTSSNETGSTASASSVNKPALVIQKPAPVTNPSDETRRAEDPPRMRPEYQAEEPHRPSPEYPPPPPPHDRRPPPPNGRWPPPPPPRRP
jgi:eukaryotic-like serine/threonine-protein kinase